MRKKIESSLIEKPRIIDESARFLEDAVPRRYYAQFGEDVIIERLIERLMVHFCSYILSKKHLQCFEFGAADGRTYSNTRWLIDRGFYGIMIEPQGRYHDSLMSLEAVYTNLTVHHERVTQDNINELIPPNRRYMLGSIDVDGQDYWLWQALSATPLFMVVEYGYNAPNAQWVPRLNSQDDLGAALVPTIALGQQLGYVAVCRTTCNVIFVRADVLRQATGPIGNRGAD